MIGAVVASEVRGLRQRRRQCREPTVIGGARPRVSRRLRATIRRAAPHRAAAACRVLTAVWVRAPRRATRRFAAAVALAATSTSASVAWIGARPVQRRFPYVHTPELFAFILIHAIEGRKKGFVLLTVAFRALYSTYIFIWRAIFDL